MTMKELRELTKNYDDNAILQISISDYSEIISFDKFGTDNEYDKSDALVLTASLDENVYFKYD